MVVMSAVPEGSGDSSVELDWLQLKCEGTRCRGGSGRVAKPVWCLITYSLNVSTKLRFFYDGLRAQRRSSCIGQLITSFPFSPQI